jgi:cyclic pyranopterin phosphate synthase
MNDAASTNDAGTGAGAAAGTTLTHLDSDGKARMVDVGDKAATKRTATATGRFMTTADVIALIKAEGMPKADVLATARIAGIMGAKSTSSLIPLCHPIPLSKVSIDFEYGDTWIFITATAATTGQTGVEMEALTAVSLAGLTLHDMVKAVDPEARMTDVLLSEKTGGKRGHWMRGASHTDASPPHAPDRAHITPREGTAVVVVASTAGAAGTRTDTTGPVISAWLEAAGFAVDSVLVVADAAIADTLAAVLATAPALILTTGGTGMSPTDATPEATRALLTTELPGVAEAIRARGLAATPTAALSRGLAGTANGTVIINLPGSPGGVKDGLAVLDGILAHLIAQVAGGGRHE